MNYLESDVMTVFTRAQGKEAAYSQPAAPTLPSTHSKHKCKGLGI